MDADILRAILKSYDDAENVAESENCKDVSREALLCSQSDKMLITLCAALSNLLCYKVSKQAYQRYSVRLLIIDILRKWCRTTSNFEHLPIFTSKENSLRFANVLLDKHLTDDILNECCSEDALISLTTAVMHLSLGNPSFMHHIDRLLIRLSQLETNDKIERLLHNSLHSNLHLKLSTKEEIYSVQKFKLIEKPLLDSFICMLPDQKKENCIENQNNEAALNKLLEFSVESMCVFQLIFNFLKELLVQLHFAPAVLHFIEVILKRISICCENQDKDILNLYPRRLHCCIILLRIKPEHHTVQTRKYILQTMKQIYDENKDVLLIIMSHFPEWLECFANYMTDDTKLIVEKNPVNLCEYVIILSSF
ncbi:uncharacterized protein LOC114942913 [Nylanderia fulva]|uniref:uncharacterized protein LOC114942913 n=1 Tax=Nylanderia fulva TaxID=613905 RepID=UPI0010FB5182|nr:uncharacterized protein LOC114942913 [Nylanderia fulva]XP_029174353.1 uncharacterized protein LOC114942913 [Nylanderia fulva]